MSLEKRKTKRELNTEESRLLVLIEDNVELLSMEFLLKVITSIYCIVFLRGCRAQLSSPVFRVLVTGCCASEPAKLYSALLL